ncbi:type III-B CRISPR module RAMP protein Cmr1 [Nocardiopsis suaedae]|uniref:Type III-B CRISPR module RAMP protein Cmr1 n=1 Tax=Nocardiopsis suaedae TaxID=3018444 RepID=A0ABT4TL16_9ACTN|nr:type III-B CRISPR module RAMP protein Cmr1 [Nocardiopsis suaedae]MDA2805405.1 type III-B CRISPR module RAMP protein Cmr1 [Nocardiopsis suaedae]
MHWITLRMRVRTPVFNGDDGAGLRPASLRGPMAFWFRALAGTVAGPDVDTLRRMEEAVFGAMGAPSPIAVRLPRPVPVEWEERPEWLKYGDRDSGLGYLLGQGMGSIVAKHYRLTRPYATPERAGLFALRIGLSGNPAVDALALAGLWLLCAYGGVGARVRRGFGGLSIEGVSDGAEHLEETPWTAETLRSPGLDHYSGLTRLWTDTPELRECAAFLPELVDLQKPEVFARPWEEDEVPTYPVLSRARTCAGLSAASDRTWEGLLSHTGNCFSRFRSAAAATPATVHTSPQEEQAVGDDASGAAPPTHPLFPLGALGLPVVYANGSRVGERRASPLWLRPVAESGGQWRLFSFAFHDCFLPGDPPVVSTHKRRGPVVVRDHDVVELSRRWVETMRKEADPQWQ